MINIGKLKLEILSLSEPVQDLVAATVKALRAHDGSAAHDAIEAALRIQFELRQELRSADAEAAKAGK